MNMKTYAPYWHKTACLSALLTLALSALGQTELPTTTYKQLLDEQRVFEVYIRDAEHEYRSLVNRRGASNPLWQNNCMSADLRLKVMFTLMDGNDKIVPHQQKIGELRKTFREAYWVNRFTTNYLGLRERAYSLQDRLNPFVDQLDPNLRNWLEDRLRQIATSGNPQGPGGNAIGLIPANKPMTVAPSGGRTQIGGGWTVDDQGNVYDQNGNCVPGAHYDAEHGTVVFPNGWSYDPGKNVFYDPNGKPAAGHPRLDSNGNIVFPDFGDDYVDKEGNWHHKDGSPSSDTHGMGARGSRSDMPPADMNNLYVNGRKLSPEEAKAYMGPNGAIKDKMLRATYTDVTGGRIDTEAWLKNDAQRRADGGLDITSTEQDDTRVSWLLSIKEAARQPAGAGFTATYNLINEGAPPDAEFQVTAWEGPGGKKSTSDTSFSVTFPQSGTYDIKAYGRTRKYDNPFVIKTTATF
jgi:hypothetical protein